MNNTINQGHGFGILFSLLMLSMAVVGCSGDQPLAPVGDQTRFLAPAVGDEDIFGIVEAIDAAAGTISLTADSTVIAVEESAEIRLDMDTTDMEVTLEDVFAGDSVRIRGAFQEDSSLLANFVRVFDPNLNNGPQATIFGRAASSDPATRSLTLLDDTTVIYVLEGAEMEAKSHGTGVVITLADIFTGDSLVVRGRFQTDGSLLASRVRLERDDVEQDRLFGVIATVDSTTRVITLEENDVQITVAQGAIIEGRSGGRITLEEVIAGDAVEIRGRVFKESAFRAFRVRLQSHSSRSET